MLEHLGADRGVERGVVEWQCAGVGSLELGERADSVKLRAAFPRRGQRCLVKIDAHRLRLGQQLHAVTMAALAAADVDQPVALAEAERLNFCG